jgi:hypothetical protein
VFLGGQEDEAALGEASPAIEQATGHAPIKPELASALPTAP